MLGLTGVIDTDTSFADVTVRAAEPTILPDAALIVVVPADSEVAFPPATMEAMDVADELHVADAVRSCVELSEKVPVAVNCWVVPVGIVGLDGVTAMDTSVAAVTVKVAEPEMLPTAAVIVTGAVPTAIAVAFPLESMVAVESDDELQATDAVRF